MPLKHDTFPHVLKLLARDRVTNWPVYKAGRRRRNLTRWLDKPALTRSSLRY